MTKFSEKTEEFNAFIGSVFEENAELIDAEIERAIETNKAIQRIKDNEDRMPSVKVTLATTIYINERDGALNFDHDLTIGHDNKKKIKIDGLKLDDAPELPGISEEAPEPKKNEFTISYAKLAGIKGA